MKFQISRIVLLLGACAAVLAADVLVTKTAVSVCARSAGMQAKLSDLGQLAGDRRLLDRRLAVLRSRLERAPKLTAPFSERDGLFSLFAKFAERRGVRLVSIDPGRARNAEDGLTFIPVRVVVNGSFTGILGFWHDVSADQSAIFPRTFALTPERTAGIVKAVLGFDSCWEGKPDE